MPARALLTRLLTALALGTFVPGHAFAEDAPPGVPTRPAKAFPAIDPAFRYEGRFDISDPHGPVIVWQNSRIQFDFEGSDLVFLFENLEGQCHFDLEIDGQQKLISFTDVGTRRIPSPFKLGPGRHRISMTKRSEAAAGWARFRGVEASVGSSVFASPIPNYRTNFLFLGDSITVGACNEDQGEDQWEDRSTHNSERSYAAEVGRTFSADFRNVAVSGMGICTGYVEPKAGEVWDRVYPRAGGDRAEVTAWLPNVIFTNFGENDGSYTRAKEQPFPANFAERYVAFIRSVRETYPKAQIVMLRGGMWNGANNEALRVAWQRAVDELTGEDSRISSFVFTHWTERHPRADDHVKMAAELIGWLRQQPFLRKD